MLRHLLLAGAALFIAGCFSSGGGQVKSAPQRHADAGDVLVPAGYRVEVVAQSLNLPTGVTFDDQGRPCVIEAGYSYGEVWATPRLVRIEQDGQVSEIARGDPHADAPPWTGVAFRGGNFYVAEGGEENGGRIVRISGDGKITPLIEHLPSMGDHHTNGPAIGPDGAIYFSIGTATNSAVVGTDNYHFGWLKRHPDFHDIPAKDITLVGENFSSADPIHGGKTKTGAYLPFGTRCEKGQVVKGQLPCTGAIMRIDPDGGNPELVAWGLRNPFGLAFAPDGKLYTTENSFDERGSRPIYGAGDVLWAIEPGTWYGWPDFHAGRPITWSDHYKPPMKSAPRFVLKEHPNEPPSPVAVLGVHSSADGFDFSRSDQFGSAGEAFIAEFGDMAPGVGHVFEPVGFKVVRVNVQTGIIHDFAVNRGKNYGPASYLKNHGLERPVAARFDPSGKSLYVVDFGVLTMAGHKAMPRQNSGVLWRITREEAR